MQEKHQQQDFYQKYIPKNKKNTLQNIANMVSSENNDAIPPVTSDDDKTSFVDPSWFESPARPLSTSGGTAAFYKLELTEEGMNSCNRSTASKDYWLGKDLSHAADEKDFYQQVLDVRSNMKKTINAAEEKNEAGSGKTNYEQHQGDITEGIGLLEAFMFDYLGVLRTEIECPSEKKKKEDDDATTEKDSIDIDKQTQPTTADLLVMKNMRNSNFQQFRMLDLKIGEKTAQAGWKGKSRFRAMKHHVMDGLSNSQAEGYRLCGFNGCPRAFDTMDPLMDILDEISAGTHHDPTRKTPLHTVSGQDIDESYHKQATRFFLNSLDGTDVFRYFYDLHLGKTLNDNDTTSTYRPIEVAEIVAHEFMTQLIALAKACHRIKIPQKWIGSSVAMAYDSEFFPERSQESSEKDIRSRVICKIFDWGRSELLLASDYEAMTPEEREDRKEFWNLYKGGIDRLSYNATRFYYQQFAKTKHWSDITIKVVDFDSMSPDDYIGQAVIHLPNPNETDAIRALNEKLAKGVRIEGLKTMLHKSTLYCSLEWVDLQSTDSKNDEKTVDSQSHCSRIAGIWRVTILKATNIPPMDLLHLHDQKGSDPYCLVTTNSTIPNDGAHFVQQTCVKARTLNPEWNETIDVPVVRSSEDLSFFESVMAEHNMPTNKHELSKNLQWDKSWPFNRASNSSMEWWSKALIGQMEDDT